MAVIRSYAVWNNKGGVGKSTITFHLASRYAEKNPDKKVLVIDLCPQSNSSMMLLGGGTTGENHVLNLCTEATPRTVVGYLSTVISQGVGAPLPEPTDYLVNVHDFNTNMPDNLYLVCGDGNLEPMAPAISGAASAPALTPTTQPWRWVHLIFNELIKNAANRITESDWMVFIDTNPSFSIYREPLKIGFPGPANRVGMGNGAFPAQMRRKVTGDLPWKRFGGGFSPFSAHGGRSYSVVASCGAG